MTLQIFVETERVGRRDVTEQVSSLRFTTRLPVGFATAAITLDAPERQLLNLINSDARGTLTVEGFGGVVWEGSLCSPGLSGDRLQLDAEGEGLQLRDRELWRIYGDAGYGWWEPVKSEIFSTDNNNRVWVASKENVTYLATDVGAVTWPESGVEPGGDVVRIECHVVMTVESGSWTAEIRADGSTVLWSSTVAVETDVALVVDDADEIGLYLYATAGGEGVASVRLTEVAVRTLYPCTSTDILQDVLALASITEFDVQASALAVDRADYQGESRLAAVEDMASLGDGSEPWVMAVYESGAIFRAWSDDADWLLTRGDLDSWSIRWNRSAVRNAVRAELPDGWRSEWFLDEDSIAQWGRRDKTLRLSRTTRVEAEAMAQIYLADHAFPLSGLRLQAGAHCHRPGGSAWWPAYRIRAGDVVLLRDFLPDQDITIQVQETKCNGKRVDITPVGSLERLELLLAVMARQIDERPEGEPTISAGAVLGATVGTVEPTGARPGTIWVDTS